MKLNSAKIYYIQRSILWIAIAIVLYLMIQQWREDFYTNNISSELSSDIGSVPISSPSLDSSEQHSQLDNPVVAISNSNGNYIDISTNVIRVRINLLGGDVEYLELLQYDAELNSEEKLILMQNDTSKVYIAQSGIIGRNGVDKGENRPIYTSSQTSYNLGNNDSLEVVLEYNDEINNALVKKIFTFKRDSYAINNRIEITNNSDELWQGEIFAQIKHTIMSPQSSGIGLASYLGPAVSTDEDNYEKIDFDTIIESNYQESTNTGWISLIQHYFVTSFIPQQSQSAEPTSGQNDLSYLLYSRYIPETSGSDSAIIGLKSSPISVEPNETYSYFIDLYSGPKINDNLEQIHPTLPLTIDFGWFWFISEFLLVILIWIHSWIGNWGWSIIILTLLVKIAFFYFNQVSFRSMAKLRALSPEMARLKEMYGDNREVMSREMMNLYKREKVNPMGGCIPILIQMPVFIALYWTLQESVEMRHSPFILWIEDLSQLDPYFVLPILMSVTMFIQQTFNPTPSDPMQARIFKWMPIIFGALFLWFPAGLTLYWVTNNALSILQQYIIKKQIESEEQKSYHQQKNITNKQKKNKSKK